MVREKIGKEGREQYAELTGVFHIFLIIVAHIISFQVHFIFVILVVVVRGEMMMLKAR